MADELREIGMPCRPHEEVSLSKMGNSWRVLSRKVLKIKFTLNRLLWMLMRNKLEV